MEWTHAAPPSLADFEVMTRRAFDALPAAFRAPCRDVVVAVADFADRETLDSLDIDDPFELTGIYHGIDLTQKSTQESGLPPDMVVLYRRPILDEWIDRGDLTLGALITHVLVHEIGHHFGFSDADMHAIEDQA